MSRFDFILKHVLGTKIEKADTLNRRPDWKVGVEKDNEDQVFIKKDWLHSMQKVVIESPEVDILEKIKNARSKDEEVVRVVEEMKKVKVKVLREDEWQIERDIVIKEGKVYVSKNIELRAEIIWLHYNAPMAGYGGRWKTMEMVTRNYWWLGITKDIGRYVESYDICQRMKNWIEEIIGKLKLSEVLEKP